MKTKLNKICVYCGASSTVDSKYLQLAYSVGKTFAQLDMELVYGGGNVGTMKAVADGALEEGGFVTGVIPEKLVELELAHTDVQKMYTTQSMHERKSLMAQLSDGFIALPGGYGTLEELAEVTTWSQLNYHKKPVGILNAFGFYDHFKKWIEHACQEQFIRSQHKNLLVFDTEVNSLLNKMACVTFIDIKEVL